MTRLHLTWSLERSPVKSRLSRVPWSRSPRAPLIGASYTGASLRRSRSVPRPCVLYVQSCTPLVVLQTGPVIFPLLFGRCGHRQISTVTRLQAHPCGFLHWARGPRSRAAGGSFLTGAVLKARSARGVSGSFCRSVLKPQLLAGCCPSVPSLAPSLTPSDS